jgi:hypothetical protein
MNLAELCSVIPKTIVKDSEAVSILFSSMQATSKVYKNDDIYRAETEAQDKLIQKAINKIIAPFKPNEILWKGVYGEKGKFVEFWMFMVGVLIIRGIDQKWSFMGPKITRREWKQIALMEAEK